MRKKAVWSKNGQQKHPVHFTGRAGGAIPFFANSTLVSREGQPCCGKTSVGSTRRKIDYDKTAPLAIHRIHDPDNRHPTDHYLHHPTGPCFCTKYSTVLRPHRQRFNPGTTGTNRTGNLGGSNTWCSASKSNQHSSTSDGRFCR